MRSIASLIVAIGVLAIGCGGATVRDSQDAATSPDVGAQSASGRLVGLGHAAIAVPDGWGTNVTRCGVPKKDTVVIDVGVVPACGTSRPVGVESVEVVPGRPDFDFRVDEKLNIDGARAQRQATTCAPGGFGGPRECVSTIYFPSLRVAFRAESSTGAAQVERILDRIQIMPDRIGVPGFQIIAIEQQERSGKKYVEVLRKAGFTAHVETKGTPAVPSGFVLDVSPRPGTMLRTGDVVTVTVVD